MRVARSANKKGTGRRGPKDDADAAPRSSTRAEDAFELVSDGVAAAVDAVELAAHAGGLFFGAGLIGAHAAASRLLWAAGCAWCVYRWTFSSERAARTAFLAALAAVLSVVESDTLVLATPDETEVVWLLRHLMTPALLGCIGAYSVVALGRAAGAGLASNGEKPPARHARTTRARKGPHHAVVAAAFAYAAALSACRTTRAPQAKALLGRGATAVAAACAGLAAAVAGPPLAVAFASGAAAAYGIQTEDCAFCLGDDAGPSVVAELDPADFGEDVAVVFLASLKLLGDNVQLGGDIGAAFDSIPQHRGGGGARSEDAWHKMNAAGDWAGEVIPLQQDLILELRHIKLELRHHVTRFVWGESSAPPRDPTKACVDLGGGRKACPAGVGTAWKIKGHFSYEAQARKIAKRNLNVTDGRRNALLYPPGAHAAWHANTFDSTPGNNWRLYLAITTGNATFLFSDENGTTVRSREVAQDGAPHAAARLFRVGRCDRRWHSIVVDSGLRFSFGYLLSDTAAAGLISRAVRVYK